MRKYILHWIIGLICLYAHPAVSQVLPVMPRNSTDTAAVYKPHQLIVKFKSSTTTKGYRTNDVSFSSKYAAFKQLGVRNTKQLHPKSTLTVQSTKFAKSQKAPNKSLSLIYRIDLNPKVNIEEAIQLLRKQPDVAYVEPVYTHYPLVVYTPNDPQSVSGEQYYLSNINAYEAWAIEKGNPNVTIGMVDFGFIPIHEDLAGNIQYNLADPIDGQDNDNDGYVDNYAGWNVAADNADLYPATGSGVHGTWTSGIAAAVADNGKGIAGTGLKCKFLPVKGEGYQEEYGSFFDGYGGLIYAALHGCKVINLSWGRRGMPSQYEQEIINELVEYYDVVIVAAAGNDNNDGLYYPASYDHVISVAGTDADTKDKRWESYDPAIGSNYNEKVDICAPSEYIMTTTYYNPTAENPYYNYYYTARSGTSMAAPQVSAAAALVRSKYPTLTAEEVTNRLLATADNIDALNPEYAGKLGRGRLNIGKALADAATLRALNLEKITLMNHQGQPYLQSGEKASIALYLKSMFGTFTNLQVKLTSKTPGVTVVKSNAAFSNFSQYQVVNNFTTPFEIQADAGLAPESKAVLQADFTDGTFTYSQAFTININPGYLTIQNNQVALTISNQGRFGYDDDFLAWFEKGSGFTYKGNNLLFEGGLLLGTSATKVSNNIMSKVVGGFNYGNTYISQAIGKDAHFNPSQLLKTNDTPAKDVELRGMFTDTLKTKNDNPIGVAVAHRNYTWQNDKFIVVEYQITNITKAAIPTLYAGISANFDIQGANNNQAQWDAANKMGYMYNKGTQNLYAGIELLTGQQPNYYIIDHVTGINLLDDYKFTAAEKFTTLSSGIYKNQSADGAQDVQQTLSAKIEDLKPGETRIVAFAFLAGDNLADLQASAGIAKTKFTQLKTSPLPVVAKLEFCKDNTGLISPSNGKNFKLYNALPLSTPVAQGSSFNLGKVTRDSTYYLVCIDSLYESLPLTLEVKAVKHTAAFTTAQDTIGLYEKEQIQLTDKSSGATQWKWSFGDNTFSSEQNPTHTYNTPGRYTIKLVSENKLGCRDSLTKEILVVNGKKSLKPIQNDQVLCNGEKLTLSPANGVQFNLYNQLPPATPLLKGSTFELGSFKKDTVFYLTSTDFLLESDPVAVHIRVSSHQTRFDMATDTLDLRLQQTLQLTDKSAGATQWKWSFGDGQTSTEQNPVHTYALPGDYMITLVTKNETGCESTLVQKVVVVQTTGLEGDLSKLIQISPNPTDGKCIISFLEGFAPNEWDIHIINLLGQTIYHTSMHASQASIDLSTFARGQYIVRLKIGNQLITRKLILL